MRVGFIGLGIMGAPMAENLVRAGHEVTAWSRTPRPLAGARIAASIDGVYAENGIVVLMLRDEAAVDAVLGRGTAAFAPRVAGTITVQMGTFTPAYSRALADEVHAAGGVYVEAPVSGSRGPAAEGTLVAMLAGPDEALDEVAPVIDAMCAQRFVCGEVPAALGMKLAVNTFLITMVTGLAEAFHFAAATGADPEVLRRVLDAGPMASAVSRGKAAKILDGDFTAQAAIADVLKNAELVEGAAAAAGIPHPLIAVCRALFADAATDHPDDDMVAVIHAIARQN
ncbi:NAD(P)-dependent oxidoreductase [Streptomyces sp. AC495_CC817]|uniref:NAD(P)-dependent oxidoreductase n=1 Tax=Streptomyces sp. AC495_CC817 TaxID=2823900 RepID=UPI001C268B0E|nr:NAD(P)-dependent oxidoreductase [Streptomyces sp. AC495_CC817]